MKTIAHTESIARLIYPDFRLPPLLKPYLKKLLPKFAVKEIKRRTMKTALFIDKTLNSLLERKTEKGTDQNSLILPALLISYGIVLAIKPIMFLPFILISAATYKLFKNK
jgi:ubiquinone biosynthesis protein